MQGRTPFERDLQDPKVMKEMKKGERGIRTPDPDSVTGSKSSELERSKIRGGAKCGALQPETDQSDPDLAKIIKAWPALRPDVKAALLTLIRQQGVDV